MKARKFPTRLIHYGDLSKGLRPIQIKELGVDTVLPCKPAGALWTSPWGSEYGWAEYCRADGLTRQTDDGHGWILELVKTARVYKIHTHKDLTALIKDIGGKSLWPNGQVRYPDWPRVAQVYDAVWLTEKGQWATRLSYPYDLYGWDCESVAVLNHEVVSVVAKLTDMYSSLGSTQEGCCNRHEACCLLD